MTRRLPCSDLGITATRLQSPMNRAGWPGCGNRRSTTPGSIRPPLPIHEQAPPILVDTFRPALVRYSVAGGKDGFVDFLSHHHACFHSRRHMRGNC